MPTGAEKLRKTNGQKKMFEAKWEWRKERDSEMSEKIYRKGKEKD